MIKPDILVLLNPRPQDLHHLPEAGLFQVRIIPIRLFKSEKLKQSPAAEYLFPVWQIFKYANGNTGAFQDPGYTQGRFRHICAQIFNRVAQLIQLADIGWLKMDPGIILRRAQLADQPADRQAEVRSIHQGKQNPGDHGERTAGKKAVQKLLIEGAHHALTPEHHDLPARSVKRGIAPIYRKLPGCKIPPVSVLILCFLNVIPPGGSPADSVHAFKGPVKGHAVRQDRGPDRFIFSPFREHQDGVLIFVKQFIFQK